MNIPNDILLLIVSRLDNTALESISQTLLWNEVSPIINNQHYWFLRVEQLVPTSIEEESGDWKRTYYILASALSRERPFSSIWDINYLSVKILLKLGFDPAPNYPNVVTTASGLGEVEVVQILLQDGRTSPHDALREAIWAGHTSIVQLLLQDKRVEPLDIDLEKAIRGNHTEIVRLLLDNEGIDPSGSLHLSVENGNIDITRLLLGHVIIIPTLLCNSISECILKGDIDIIRLLIEAGVNPSDCDNYYIISASANGQFDIVQLLLVDKRVNPSARHHEAIRRAVSNGHREIVDLLIRDSRVNILELSSDIDLEDVFLTEN